MIAPARATSARRLVALTILSGATFAIGQLAEAQVAPIPAPGVAAPGFPIPVEIAINVLNGQVLCQPKRVRLPARDAISLRVINSSMRPIMFAAPEFFQASEGMRTGGVTYNSNRGGFLVEAGSTLPVLLTTPPAGEYYCACYELGEVSTVRGSGFIIVVLGSGGQALPRR